MDFSPFPEKEPDPSSLTASHLRQYIAQQLCPRLAYFQRMRFMAKSHPRLIRQEEERQSKRNERERFRALVLQELQKKYRVCPESEHFRWEEALEEVVRTGEPLFFVQPMLTMQQEMRLQGRPHLIYLKRESSYVYAEVWDIREGYTVSYAQKWKIAFYAYLLESFLTTIAPLQPVRVADMGGIMHRSEHEDQLLDRTYFSLRDFRDTMPHLLRQWMDDSKKPHAHTMESSCTSCSYFSYCYQETLGQLPPVQDPHILYVGNASNQFPSNTKHWFFLFAYSKKIQWECWEGGECIDAGDATKERYEPFYRRWMQSAQQGKNPHVLVLEDTDWEVCKKMFHKTPVAAIWGLHVCWTSMQSVWEEHFVWPFQGKVTATQVALSLGLLQDREPLFSLYHTDKAIPLSREIYRKIWAWCFSHIKSRRKVLYNLPVGGSLSLIPSYQAVLHREQECRTHAILEFQRNPLPHRVENFRAIGPLRFVAVDGPKRYLFSLVQRGPIAKFKVGDYLKLSPLGSSHLQEGFSVILEFYCPDQGRVVVRSLLRRITIHPHQLYVLDECAEDRNTSKMQAVLQQFAKPHFRPEILQLLQGRAPPSLGSTEWVENWDFAHAALSRLNASQKQALFLPFVKNVGLIEGPPGTGKTHLLVWTIVALCAHARSLHQHIKILVTAQTHQAINQILKKTAQALKTLSMEGITFWKRGRYDPLLFGRCGVQSLEEATQLLQESLCIVGATGFGIYQLFEGAQFPQIFDWVVFDESSQVLPAYALLGLIFGKGKALFYGDIQQLPPVILGNYEDTSFPPRSILEELILRYPSDHRVRLGETYRMNDKICRFVSQNWYENELFSGVPKEWQRWDLPRYPLFGDSLDRFLDPSRPMEVVFVSHEGSQQSSREEAIWIAEAVKRCLQDYCVPVEEIGIISPHRLQNNTIGSALKEALPFATQLPKVDTVERMQGAEFDVVFFSATVSDPKTLHTPFLRDYRRLNVALTRARKKCIFVASPLFFHTFPMHEKQLRSHLPFLAFLQAAFPI